MNAPAEVACRPIDRALLQQDFDALSAITEPNMPWTRRSFTPRFLEGRNYLRDRFVQEGLAVRIDPAGNLIGRWDGQEPSAPVLMTGSHSDTVPSGGRFDGIAGLLAGLSAIRALRQGGYQPRHPIELVDFLAEEPSEWGLSCIGSRGMSGLLADQHLALTGPGGERLDDAIRRMGGAPEHIGQPLRKDIAAFLEIHIEQGPVLEARRVPIGIVTGIASIARVRIRIEGVAAHAGTAPMSMRADAGVAMARLMLAVRDRARTLNQSGHFTATVGVLRIEPNGANVVPGAAEAMIDIRAEIDEAMDAYLENLEQMAINAAILEGCRVAAIDHLSRTHAVTCDADLRECIGEAATELGLGTLLLASGAGHDAAFIARLAPSAMMFVPSRDGKSHSPDEWTDTEAVALAADVLARTLRHLDGRPAAGAP